jgi:hypothetical protein
MRLAKERGIETPTRQQLAKLDRDGERVNPEGVTDKAWHSRAAISALTVAHVRTYSSEPQRGRQRWKGQHREQQAVYANRHRIGGVRGKWLLPQPGEKLQRWNEHLYDRGGMQLLHLMPPENWAPVSRAARRRRVMGS